MKPFLTQQKSIKKNLFSFWGNLVRIIPIFILIISKTILLLILFTFLAKDICGFHIKLGVSLSYIFKRIGNNISKRTEDFLQDFQHKEYLIFVDIKEKIIFVVLKKNIEQDQILKAYFHACLCGVLASMSQRLPIVSFFDCSKLSFNLYC